MMLIAQTEHLLFVVAGVIFVVIVLAILLVMLKVFSPRERDRHGLVA